MKNSLPKTRGKTIKQTYQNQALLKCNWKTKVSLLSEKWKVSIEFAFKKQQWNSEIATGFEYLSLRNENAGTDPGASTWKCTVSWKIFSFVVFLLSSSEDSAISVSVGKVVLIGLQQT